MKLKTLTQVGVLVALSVIGAFIKIPSVVGSLAFDAVPGYFAALCFSPVIGASVAVLGHAATATWSGFPLGIPVHMLISTGMCCAAYTTGALAKHNLYVGALAGVLINGLLLPAVFIALPQFGTAFFVTATPSILAASVLNVTASVLLYRAPVLRSLSRGH